MRSFIRDVTPYSMRLALSRSKRFLKYRLGIGLRYAARYHDEGQALSQVACVSLPIRDGDQNPNKTCNIKLCCSRLSGIVIEPGETLSFWRQIGRPTQKAGFQSSRALVNGRLEQEVGGGVCMVSGAIYYLALKLGLEVIERHNHSVDIYTNETRFTPLGTDATVVYGFKDLQLRNPYRQPIVLSISVQGSGLQASFLCPENLKEKALRFEQEKQKNCTEVRVFQDEMLAATSTYLLKAPAGL